VSCAKTAEPIEGPFWFLDSGELKEQCVFWGPDRPCEGAILGETKCLGMLDETLPCVVQK